MRIRVRKRTIVVASITDAISKIDVLKDEEKWSAVNLIVSSVSAMVLVNIF